MNSDHILTLTHRILTDLSVPVRKAAAAAAMGLISGGVVGIAALGRAMEGKAQPNSKARRVERLVTNPRLRVDVACGGLTRALIKPNGRTLVCLDWTDHGRFQRLELSVVTGSRALPVYWTVVAKADIEGKIGSQNLIEEWFLREFVKLLPVGAKVVILADRGFGRTGLFRFLKGLPVDFVIRAKGDAWLRNGAGTFRMDEQPVEPGQVWDLGEVNYKEADRDSVKVRVVVARGTDAKEPWYLVTNLMDDARIVAGAYGRRFEIEESFRDQKDNRFGFGLRDVEFKEPVRLARMLVVVALACLVAFGGGVEAEALGWHRQLQVNTSRQRQHNLVALGCFWFRRLRRTAKQMLAGVSMLALEIGKAVFRGVVTGLSALVYRQRPPRRRRPPTQVDQAARVEAASQVEAVSADPAATAMPVSRQLTDPRRAAEWARRCPEVFAATPTKA